MVDNTKSSYSLEDVQKINEPTKDFLVKLEDNTYGIKFIGFRLRDLETAEVFHEYLAQNKDELDYFASHVLVYYFSNKILKAKTIGADLNFCVGDKPVKNLDFIEKHYINGKLEKSYEFKFPFYMPNSSNSIEFIYPVPKMSKDTEDKLKKGENIEAFSDTFILVEGKLIIHRRASYTYSEL